MYEIIVKKPADGGKNVCSLTIYIFLLPFNTFVKNPTFAVLTFAG